jgi:outer membrane biosynthesis protein TonB
VVEEFVERSRGTSPPQMTELDLETLKSASLLHAAVVAIILGVIPALWINRWRAESAASPRVETAQPQAAASDDDTETIEMTAEPEPETVQMPGTITSPAIKASKPHRPKTERVKQPTPRARKQPPPCDVYLHPKGCPR